MNHNDELIKKADIQKIAAKGTKIYEKVKNNYEPQNNGKFIAINVDNEDIFLADNSSEAVEKARQKYPNKVFYVVKIGYSATEIMAKLKTN
ncbi:hypothetical protein KJ713_00735 [Patescibacteria group bacterium]|nr:hypothetical protein [Patescibacteria group bacterium]